MEVPNNEFHKVSMIISIDFSRRIISLVIRIFCDHAFAPQALPRLSLSLASSTIICSMSAGSGLSARSGYIASKEFTACCSWHH